MKERSCFLYWHLAPITRMLHLPHRLLPPIPPLFLSTYPPFVSLSLPSHPSASPSPRSCFLCDMAAHLSAPPTPMSPSVSL